MQRYNEKPIRRNKFNESAVSFSENAIQSRIPAFL